MKRRQKSNKKGMVGQMALVIIGLLLAAITLAVMMGGTKEIMDFMIQLIIPHHEPDPTDTASYANFDRLNDEIKWLLDETASEKNANYLSKDFPYTLGGSYDIRDGGVMNLYHLIGFNSDQDSNQCIFDSTGGINKLKITEVPQKCLGRSCLCLCSYKDGCLSENCVLYKDIDYFISGDDDDVELQKGKVIPSIIDPISEKEANCLVLLGGDGLKKWVSRDLHVEIIRREKNYLYISQSSAATLAREEKMDCSMYEDKYDCAEGKDSLGDSCVPDYVNYGFVKSFKECIICPDDETLDYYENDWLISVDPCGYVPEPAPKDVCSSYGSEYDCAYGDDMDSNRCYPKSGSCLKCEQDCEVSDYKGDWLITLDPCECWDDVAARVECKNYKDQYSCAIGKDEYNTKCVPAYAGLVVATPYLGCEECLDECELDGYPKDWLKIMNPCDCVNSLE